MPDPKQVQVVAPLITGAAVPLTEPGGNAMRQEGTKKWSIRAWGLFLSSLACVTRGFLYLPPVATGQEPLPLGVGALTSIIPAQVGSFSWQPVWLFGAAWLAVGCAGLYEVAKGRAGNRIFLAMIMLMVFWAFGFLGSTLLLGSRSGWVVGFFYLVLAGYTLLFRRMRTPAPATPATVAARIRVDDDVVFYWHNGEWVEIYPEVQS